MKDLDTLCDFCEDFVPFIKVIYSDPFWGLEAVHEGAGSDHLAIWCHKCGPKHRK